MSNPVVHFEIGCRETAAAARFYQDVFGWNTSSMGPALMIQTGSQEGIQGHFTALGHEPFRYTIFYVQVEDIGAQLEKVAALGGKVMVPQVDIPNSGSFAWITDPDGNTVGLWKPAAKG
jgi:predicted enzyme related to lactoylglutathione lyase